MLNFTPYYRNKRGEEVGIYSDYRVCRITTKHTNNWYSSGVGYYGLELALRELHRRARRSGWERIDGQGGNEL